MTDYLSKTTGHRPVECCYELTCSVVFEHAQNFPDRIWQRAVFATSQRLVENSDILRYVFRETVLPLRMFSSKRTIKMFCNARL